LHVLDFNAAPVRQAHNPAERDRWFTRSAPQVRLQLACSPAGQGHSHGRSKSNSRYQYLKRAHQFLVGPFPFVGGGFSVTAKMTRDHTARSAGPKAAIPSPHSIRWQLDFALLSVVAESPLAHKSVSLIFAASRGYTALSLIVPGLSGGAGFAMIVAGYGVRCCLREPVAGERVRYFSRR